MHVFFRLFHPGVSVYVEHLAAADDDLNHPQNWLLQHNKNELFVRCLRALMGCEVIVAHREVNNERRK